MQLLIAGLIGLILHASVGSEELLEGHVRLSSGEPVVGATVRLTDRGRLVNTTATDARGWFALPLRRTALPITFTLGQNYPNPFNPSTVIPYQLSAASHVRLEVFNLLGQHLATLVDAYMSAGRYEAQWGGTDAAGRAVGAGVYIYRMTVGVESQTGRMVLLDGQAGVSAGGMASVMPGASDGGGADGEQMYGLVVSGAGLAPYVDSSFRVEAGMAPVELVVSSGHSGGKAADDDCAFCDLFDALNDDDEGPGPSGKAQATLEAPAAPTNLRFEAVTGSSCTVCWDAAAGATDYDVNYKPAVGGEWTNEPHRGTGLCNTINDLAPDTEYRWAVRAENSDGRSAWVFGPNFTTLADETDETTEEEAADGQAPAAPTNLRFDAPTDSSCTVRWDAAAGATDYDVNYKPAVGGEWTNEPHRGTGLYNTINDLAPDTEYRWAVRAENSDGRSAWVFGPNFTTVEEETQKEEEESPSDSSPSYPGGGRIYWLESSWKEDSWGDREEVIYQANLDGSNIESLYSTLGQSISDFTLDIDGGWMYWLQGHPASVWRARLDGSGEEEIVSTPMGISSFDLDVDSNRIYWWDWPNYSIWRANLDGSEPQEIVSNSVSSPYVDLAASQIYWAVEVSGTYTFCRENFDGSDEKCIPSDVPVGSSFIIIGAVNGSIAYWRYERCGGGVCRGIAAFTDFDTGEVKPLEGLPQDPKSLWTFENHIYWRYFGGIWRTNVDRSNPEEIIRYDSIDIINVREFGLDLSKNRACWVGQENRANGGHIVQCANLDRSGLDESSVENVFDISFTSHFAGRLVFDMAGNRTFWLVKSEPRLSGFNIESEYSIWRASLDDPEPQKIVSEVRNNVELWTQILALEISPQD